MEKNKGERWVTLKNGRRIKITPKSNNVREKVKDKLNNNLGPEYKGYKGKDAIDKLMKEKKGYIKGAFYRKDIGDIDLIWGDDKMGLKHIIKRRKETGQNLKEVLNNMTDVIGKGNLKKIKLTGKSLRYKIDYKDNCCIVSSELYGKKNKVVITSYELY